jgi:hypothetical protein
MKALHYVLLGDAMLCEECDRRAAWRAGREAERGKASRAPGRTAAVRIRSSISITIRHQIESILLLDISCCWMKNTEYAISAKDMMAPFW